MSIDRETPTPRITNTWQDHVSRARALADRLREVELVRSRTPVHAISELDPHSADRLRRTRMLVEAYVAAFNRWTQGPIPFERKSQELREFEALDTFARVCLGEIRP